MTRQRSSLKLVLVAAVIAAIPILSFTQGSGDLTHVHPAIPNAAVDFGVLPTAPLGPPPCSQVAPFGGPTDPCAYKNHHLTPEEVTILKEGQVTFQIHGGGHAMAIYEVSKDTTGFDRTLDPADHPCVSNIGSPPPGTTNAAAEHEIADGHGDVVIVAEPNVTNVHPDNRVWSEPGRLMSAGGVQFLNGGTTPTGTTSTGGQLVTYRFLKTGRYLVICMNRNHFLNDWMFGFVNVTGQ